MQAHSQILKIVLNQIILQSAEKVLGKLNLTSYAFWALLQIPIVRF